MGIGVFILLAYTLIALYFHYGYNTDAITYNSITVNGEEDIFEAGNAIDIHYDRCSTDTYPAHITYALIPNNEAVPVVTIGTLDVVYEKGCKKFIGGSISLPFSTRPGEYRLRLTITYEIVWVMNLHKHESLVETTESFYVVNNFNL